MEKLNKYVIVVNDDTNALLYNTINGSLLLFERDKLLDDSLIDCSEDEKETLVNYSFIGDQENSLRQLIQERNIGKDILIVTVSITQACNIACSYCSQNDSKTKGIIDFEIIDSAIEYIVNVFDSHSYKSVAIDFFGGEPLLGRDRILYFKRQIEKQLNPNKISYAIDTNGVLLEREFINSFDQLNVNITLSGRKDHDKLRAFRNGHGTYDVIVNNLSNCLDLFDQDKRQIRLRYNVSENKDEFANFVKEIKTKLPNIEYIEVAHVVDHSFNQYRSGISPSEYSQWYVDECIDCLLENNIFVDFPRPLYSLCRAYSPHDIKINFDGKLTLCSAMHFNQRKSHIDIVKEDIKVIGEVFEEKIINPYDQECMSCKYVFICGGKQMCKEGNYCDFAHYNLEPYFQKVLQYAQTDKMNLFSI